MDYGRLIDALATMKEKGEIEEDAAILLDMLTVSWLQEGRALPKSQEEMDALLVRAMAIATKVLPTQND